MTNAQPAETSPPDWSRIDGDVVCPMCEYNLRGLTEPRCPECGYPFEWPEILDPNRQHHRYLFEHHPERRAWSFAKTLMGALLPRRLWRSLHPSQPSHPKRLILYWCLASGLYLLVLAGLVFVFAACVGRVILVSSRFNRPAAAAVLKNPPTEEQSRHAKAVVSRYGSIKAYLDEYYPVGITWPLMKLVGRETLRVIPACTNLLLVLVWPWLVFVGLLVFRVSMRRARVRPVHVLRCVLYSYDAFAWAGVVLVVLAALATQVWSLGSDVIRVFLEEVAVWPALAVLPLSAYRLGVACRLYLRFDYAFSAVLAAHAIVVLFLANLVTIGYLCTGWRKLIPLLPPFF